MSQSKDLFPAMSAFQQLTFEEEDKEEASKKLEPKVANKIDIEDLYFKLNEAIYLIKDRHALRLVTEVADELYRNLR